VLVEALVAQTAIEALDEAILHRFARSDVVPLDAAILLPGEDRVRGELGAVVTDDHAGIAPLFGDPIKFAGDTKTGERGVHHQTEAFPGEVIDQREDAEAPAAHQRIRDQVERPAQIAVLRDGHRRSGAESALSATAPANGQPLFSVEPIELLVAQSDSFASEQQT
jgi:hypothetical protein